MSELTNPFMHFQIIKDYRQESKVEHKLSDLILLTICGVFSGHDGWDGIIDFGNARLDFLKRYGHFEAGIPSADTLSRVMGMINPAALQRSFIAQMKDCHTLTDGEVIAIDGKTLRGSYDRSKGKGTIHMVNAFATVNGMSIGQQKVDSKSNEITAIPKLLDLLEVKGFLVTIDAMGCQKKIAQKILDKEADYLLAVKGNQGMLEQAFDDYFRMNMLQDFDGRSYSTQEKSHGRIVCGDRARCEYSLLYMQKPKRCLKRRVLIRSHWGVEAMHWSLDTAFCEDNSRIIVDDRAESLARIRQMCLSLLKSETTSKCCLLITSPVQETERVRSLQG